MIIFSSRIGATEKAHMPEDISVIITGSEEKNEVDKKSEIENINVGIKEWIVPSQCVPLKCVNANNKNS